MWMASRHQVYPTTVTSDWYMCWMPAEYWNKGPKHVLLCVITMNQTQFIVILLVSWRFEPSQPQKITSGLDTNCNLSPSYPFHKSSYHKSCFSLFIFRGHSTQEPASNRVTNFILRAYTGSGVSHSQHRKKMGEVLEKMQMNGPEG